MLRRSHANSRANPTLFDLVLTNYGTEGFSARLRLGHGKSRPKHRFFLLQGLKFMLMNTRTKFRAIPT